MKDRRTNPFSRLLGEIRCAMCGRIFKPEPQVVEEAFEEARRENKDNIIVTCPSCQGIARVYERREITAPLENKEDDST
jgi:phage FluMu protein Com